MLTWLQDGFAVGATTNEGKKYAVAVPGGPTRVLRIWPSREFLRKVTTSWPFEGGILLTIWCSAVCLALEDPRTDPKSEKAAVR